MPSKCKHVLLAAALAVCSLCSRAQAQWLMIKGALQPEVNILEETAARLVLYREDSTATLLVTLHQSQAADLYGALEAKRGGNAFRVWVMTENFWRKPHLAEDGGRKFFREAFIKTLRAKPALQKEPDRFAPSDTVPATVAPPSTSTVTENVAVPDSTKTAINLETAAIDSLPSTQEKPAAPIRSAQRRTSPSARSTPPSPRKRAKASPRVKPAAPIQAQPPLASVPVAPVLPAVQTTPLDSLYQIAAQQMEQTDWAQAVIALEKIQSLQPNYRDTGDRLVQARINASLAETRQVQAQPPQSVRPSLFASGALIATGAFIALILLPMFGVILFSATFRARYHIFRGEPAKAAPLYEKYLARRPGKTRLYAELADVYLLLGRRDEQALKVYKTVLQLKLATKNREAINAIVAQKYLVEGKTDVDIIEVLEDALKAERRKQNPGTEERERNA